jgi:transposase-like protein
MSDEPEEPPTTALESTSGETRAKRAYSDDEKYMALVALRLNGSNVYRTANALGIPVATLRDWKKQREAGTLVFGENPLAREKRGDLAAKLEDRVHSVVESIDDRVIQKATLSQRAVFVGIGIDKLKILKGEGLEPDPRMEICRLMGINQAEIPTSLQLAPGEEIPEEFRNFLDLEPNAQGIFEAPPPPDQFTHSSLPGILTADSSQSDIPDGFVRVTNEKDQTFILSLSELTLFEPLEPVSDDQAETQLLDALDDESTDN